MKKYKYAHWTLIRRGGHRFESPPRRTTQSLASLPGFFISIHFNDTSCITLTSYSALNSIKLISVLLAIWKVGSLHIIILLTKVTRSGINLGKLFILKNTPLKVRPLKEKFISRLVVVEIFSKNLFLILKCKSLDSYPPRRTTQRSPWRNLGIFFALYFIPIYYP